MNNILCKCQEHEPIQQYLHNKYDPKLGKRNLILYKQSTNSKQNKVPKSQSNSLTCKIMTANTTINGAHIGCISCMSETVIVKDKYKNSIRIQVHYDSGSQHSLGSKLINRVVLAKRTSSNPIVLSIVSGETKEIK